MMDDSVLKCKVCSRMYSDDSIPRNLGCGHCLCTNCAGEVISTDKTCLECQAKITRELDQLTINYPLLRVARSLASSKTEFQQELSGEDSSASSREQCPLSPPNATLCKIHGKVLDQRCMQCHKWICQDCLSAFHSMPHRSHCRVLPLNEALKEMQSSVCHEVELKIAATNKLQRDVEKEELVINRITEQQERSTSSIKTAIEHVKNTFEDLECKLQSQNKIAMVKLDEIQSMIELLQQERKHINKSKTPNELLQKINTAQNVLETVDETLVTEQHRPSLVLPKMLSVGKYNLQALLQAEKTVFATCEGQRKCNVAKVTGKDGVLYLHALHASSHIPNGAVSVSYNEVQRLVPTECPTVFLDVGIAGLMKGTVHMRMFGDTTRGRQMTGLCSGEHGVSYRMSRFYKAERNSSMEILMGGDFEENNGTSRKGIIMGIEDGGVYRAEIVAGLLVGWPAEQKSRLGAFNVHLRQCPGSYDNHSFGMVTLGLDVLRTVAKHHPVNDSMITDCGLVIHL